ncbi:MFS transporter [Methanobrevibacter sp.]|uniref:MFS transporter n=1 Tax=Methanobrevibacter sp. TaxID=66852 RepID=UPI00388CF0E3
MKKEVEDKRVIILGCLLLFCVQFIANMVTVALPTIASDLSLNVEMLNAINLVFLVTSVSLMLPLGKFASKYGIGRYLKYSIVLMIAGLLFSAFSTDINSLLISRIFQGVATAVINGAMYVIVTVQLPSDKLGYALGIMGSCGYIGLCLSNTISGLVVYYLSWRTVFLILIPIYIITLLILINLDKEWNTDDIDEIDKTGSIIYILFMGLFLYGIVRLDDNNIFILLLSILFLIMFLKVEKNKKHPLYNLKLFKNFKYVLGNYSAFVMYFMTFIASYILNFYLQNALGYDARLTGLFLLTTPLAVVFVSSFAGKLSDKRDERTISAIALMFILVNVVLMFFMDCVPVYILLIACVLQGIGHGLFSSPNNRFVLTLVDQKDLSDASTMLSTSKDVGKSMSLSLFSITCGFVLGTSNALESNIPLFITSSKIMLAIVILLGISSIILLIFSKIKKPHNA